MLTRSWHILQMLFWSALFGGLVFFLGLLSLGWFPGLPYLSIAVAALVLAGQIKYPDFWERFDARSPEFRDRD